MEIALEGANLSVVRASSAAEAIKCFDERSGEIDVVLTDARLGMDSGLDLARRFLAVKPTLKVLVTSGFPVSARRIHDAGSAVTFLPKPFSSSELRKKLHALFLGEAGSLKPEQPAPPRTVFSPTRSSISRQAAA